MRIMENDSVFDLLPEMRTSNLVSPTGVLGTDDRAYGCSLPGLAGFTHECFTASLQKLPANHLPEGL